MLSIESIKDIVHEEHLSHKDRMIVLLASDRNPKSSSEIRKVAEEAGLNDSILRNITAYLKSLKGFVISTSIGWELTKKGKEKVHELTGIEFNAKRVQVAAGLRSHLSDIQDAETKKFVDQAIKCHENSLHRPAVVFSWVGAVSLLQDYIIKNRLVDFNNEASRRDSKWKAAKTKDDLSKMKEFDFLQILVAISVIGKNVKDELEGCLKLRNGCGHPNSLRIGESRVAAHIETLMLNVFSKFT